MEDHKSSKDKMYIKVHFSQNDIQGQNLNIWIAVYILIQNFSPYL